MMMLIIDLILAIVGGTSFLLGGYAEKLIDDRITSRVANPDLIKNQLDFILLLEACAASAISTFMTALILREHPTSVLVLVSVGLFSILQTANLAFAGSSDFAGYPSIRKLLYRIVPCSVLLAKSYAIYVSTPVAV